MLAAHRPRLLELDLGDEEAWEIGLTCGGTIEVFVEPVDLEKPTDDTLAVYERFGRTRRPAGAGRVLRPRPRRDQHDGAKMLLLDTGAREGTLGDGGARRRGRRRGGGRRSRRASPRR